MKKQRMMDTSNLGDDTTVRDYNSNKFKSQSYETFGMITGEISGQIQNRFSSKLQLMLI